MSLRRCLLFIYRSLLYLYPCAFRHRFANEMMQLAAEAETEELPLIFGDTSLGIVRSWLDPSASTSTAPAQDTYVMVGGSAITALRLFQGLALALVLILGFSYLGSSVRMEAPMCHAIAAENISW